ncbi:unnamed protein product, partial [Ectocarpus sp. 12 AP-2014]
GREPRLSDIPSDMADLVEGSPSRGSAAAGIDRHGPLLRRRRRGVNHLSCPAEVAVGLRFSSGAARRTRMRRTATGAWARDRLRVAVDGVATFMCARSAKVVLLSVVLSLSPMWCRVGGVTVAPTPAPAEHDDSLWDTISGDPDFSKLTACLEMADPSVMDLLKASPGSAATAQPLTLFAPTDMAFEQPAWRKYSGGGGGGGGGNGEADHNGTIFDDRCQDEQSATALVSYHVSTMASATPYIGTIWKTLCSDPSFSLLAAALNSTSLAATLDADGGGAGATAYTLFAPDDNAIKASPEFPQDDPEALEVLLSFHTLAAGVYPLSLSGAHFSQQLYKVDPTSGSLSRDYYREFYADSFEDGQFTSLAGPLLNVSRTSSSQSSSSLSCLASQQQQQEDPLLHQSPPPPPPPPGLRPPVHSALSLLVEGVPVSEADITATNGVVHRLSAAVMAPPDTVAGVLLSPPFPLSAAGGGGGSGGAGSGFGAMGELVRLAWPLVNATLTEEGPLTVLAPTDAAFDIAIAAGDLPPRPWYEVNSTSSSSSSSLGAWVFQCVDGTGVGHDCGTSPRPSNTYALNGAHLCAVHAVDRVMFPADPSTDLAAILDGTPSLSRFAALLREHGLLAPPYPSSPSSSSSFLSAAAAGARPAALTRGDSEVVVGGSQKQKDKGRGGGGGGGGGGHRVSQGSRATFLTVFAPTNAALARLEKERPWLFRNSTATAAVAAAAAVGGEAGGKEAAGEGGKGDADDWPPVRELLAYHLVPGAALFSR